MYAEESEIEIIDDWHETDSIGYDDTVEDNPFFSYGEGFEEELKKRAGIIEEEE